VRISRYPRSITLLKSGETVQYLNATKAQAYYRSRKEPFWFEYKEASRTIYFRYARCEDPSGFARVSGELWKVVDEKPVDRLVIDFHGYGGAIRSNLTGSSCPSWKSTPP